MRATGWTPAPELHATKAVCKTHLYTDAFCEIRYEGPGESGELNYFTIGPWGSPDITFVRAADGHVSLQQAVGRVWRRAISLAAMLAMLALVVLAGLRNAFAGASEAKAAPAAPAAPQAPAPAASAARAGAQKFGRR